MSLKDSKHLCILPWIHMHIWPNGVTYPCCLASNDYIIGNSNESSFKELWNSEKMKDMRLNMLNDRPTTGCERCYEHEQFGDRSMRMNMNYDFEHLFDRAELTNPDGSLDDIHMAYLDIRFSNICNMKCRTCGPELSSQWVDDAVKMGRYDANAPKILKINHNLDELWQDMVTWIDTVEQIYFAGGEPLIMDEHYKILEYLIEIGKTDIQIAYNTNFSKLTYKNKDVVELWKHFSDIKVGASLDAMGDRAEYMRSGTRWSDIEANRLRLMQEVPHVEFKISCTVSAYNAEHCVDFFDDWIERGWIKPWDIGINMLVFPEYQRAQVLPAHLRERTQQKIQQFIEKHGLNNRDQNGRAVTGLLAFSKFLDEDRHHLWDKFQQYNNQMDTIRNEKLEQTFPELV